MIKFVYECNTNSRGSDLIRQVLRTILLAIRSDAKLERGVAQVGALTMNTNMESCIICRGLAPRTPKKWPARSAAQLPPQRGNPRKNQVPDITK